MHKRRIYIYRLKCPHCRQEHLMAGVTEDALHPVCFRCGGFCEVACVTRKEAVQWVRETPLTMPKYD